MKNVIDFGSCFVRIGDIFIVFILIKFSFFVVLFSYVKFFLGYILNVFFVLSLSSRGIFSFGLK